MRIVRMLDRLMGTVMQLHTTHNSLNRKSILNNVSFHILKWWWQVSIGLNDSQVKLHYTDDKRHHCGVIGQKLVGEKGKMQLP